MYCTKDCNCSLCRELRGFRPGKGVKKPAPRPPLTSSILGRLNENFILRRRVTSSIKTFQPQSLKCSEMCQQRDIGQIYDFCQRQTQTPSPTPVTQAPPSPQSTRSNGKKDHKPQTPPKPNHKVVIYFGDSLAHRSNKASTDEAVSPTPTPLALQLNTSDLISQMQNEITSMHSELPPYIESVQNGVINIKIEGNYQQATALVDKVSRPCQALVGKPRDHEDNPTEDDDDDDGRYQSDEDDAEAGVGDWSFVQGWRARPVGNIRPDFCSQRTSAPFSYTSGLPATSTSSANMGQINASGFQNCSTSTVRIHSPAVATPAPRIPKEVAQRPLSNLGGHSVASASALSTYSPTHLENGQTKVDMRALGSQNGNNLGKLGPQRAISGPSRLTAQSTPVRSQPAMLSGSLSQQPSNTCGTTKCSDRSAFDYSSAAIGIPIEGSYQSSPSNVSKGNHPTRTHHHEFRALERVKECHSSSDENRSSGHASMSDTGGHGSSSPGGVALCPLPEDRLAAVVTNRSTRSRTTTNHSRARHRATPAKAPWSGNGLEDIKLAIQQLTMRSQTSTSTYSSISSESSEPARRLGRYASLETVNTNVTSADEFVWVDSHNRLVELQHPPWSQQCIIKVMRDGRCKEYADRVAPDALSRLGYLLQRALVRIAREIQRLSSNLGLCSKQEVAGAFKIVLCPALADSCIKACLRAAAMFAVPGDSALKQSKSSRAGIQLSVGRFHRWMTDSRLGKFIHEYAAVYLCAGMENLLEEILLQCFPADSNQQLTSAALEHAISLSADMWGLLQPFAHLNAGRIASGALTMPRWASQSSLGSGTHRSGSSGGSTNVAMECLLTTCVGSISELKDLAQRAQQKFQQCSISSAALSALFYFMRCSQLEHSEFTGQQLAGASGNNANSTQNIQELCYERAYVVLPPLVEWLRVASAHAEYRNSVMIDKDDIMQAARLLLPGVDCPMRSVCSDEELTTKKSHFPHLPTTLPSSLCEDTTDLGKRATIALAFKLMLTGRAELLAQASNLLPVTTRYDTLNHAGMTALMIASIRNDDVVIQALLDAGCEPNIEVPAIGNPNYPAIHPDTQHWTAVTFAASRGNYVALRVLLERGGKVEGGARQSEDKHTLTPLQVACGSGNIEVVSLLLLHGANAFLSTQQKDSMSFAGSAQRGCYCAISVAAAHGQRSVLRKLLYTPISQGSKDVLSLEEMLAEGDSSSTRPVAERLSSSEIATSLSKTQIKSLQEAMYHSAENNHLDITIELRTLGVPWTLHCWMHALAAAHELRLEGVIDQLLQDFLQVCPDDYSVQFVSECLPLLFNIFRYSKNEGTTLLLADIFATCYGWQQIKPIEETSSQPINSSRIDPKFVNNPELSDVIFRVEGKLFYGHKIVLVTASPRFQSMLSSKLSDSSIPTVQINDIRYHIFQLVMQYLYSGGCTNLDVSKTDVLELMAAASFFQLEGLLRYTESRCSEMIDIDNVVAMYIHAKVYSANKLLEFCQGFLLQNMVALLTYDDSVKRLLFAKKIPNHDVLIGLLQALQQRIKERKSMGPFNFRQQLSSPSESATAASATNATK
ncbi:ankyrin repeat and BTB/POZ domain-containing protein 2 [Musca vetustissima]|uniref:ankyrin repeat and BTB/POZ domain-containing protein 2 n=1 Tax=Musca vetustissima TaxID=27455 RepID=UPI002AB6DC10|nr:ankyrin repeat and BTB/POZ domain-containing protein 2 [Musca vetustissima]